MNLLEAQHAFSIIISVAIVFSVVICFRYGVVFPLVISSLAIVLYWLVYKSGYFSDAFANVGITESVLLPDIVNVIRHKKETDNPIITDAETVAYKQIEPHRYDQLFRPALDNQDRLDMTYPVNNVPDFSTLANFTWGNFTKT